jgi:hypothetical protein
MTVDLDTAFRYELAEIIERRLVVYRPILSHLAMATFRHNLLLSILDDLNVKPELGVIIAGRPSPVHGTDQLTAGQVALLGGTRPLRILHAVSHELNLSLDGGDKRSLKQATEILQSTNDALRSFVVHHEVAPAKGRDASARNLAALVDLGIATQIASTMGALHHHLQYPADASGEDDVIKRYFLGMVQVFGRIKLARNDQKVFSDHYIDGRDVDDLVEDDGRDLAEEVELRHEFLKRLAKALKAQIKLATGRPAPPQPLAELPAESRSKTLPGRE